MIINDSSMIHHDLKDDHDIIGQTEECAGLADNFLYSIIDHNENHDVRDDHDDLQDDGTGQPEERVGMP